MRRALRLAILSAAIGSTVTHPALASTRVYVGPTNGVWLTAAQWSPSGAPASNDTAILPSTYAGTYSVSFGGANYNSATPLLALRISSQSGASATLIQDQAGSAMAAVEEHIGELGTGIYTQSAGTNTVTAGSSFAGFIVGESSPGGTYNLIDGTLSVAAGSERVGSQGFGTFNQSGGTNTTGSLSLGANSSSTNFGNGTYLISNGTLNFKDLSIGDGNNGAGTFMQTGGLVNGPLNSAAVAIGRGQDSFGNYILSAGTLTHQAIEIGNSPGATGLFIQTGGMHIAGLYMDTGGFGTGTYLLSGGTVSTDLLFVAASGTGDWIQSGGVVTCNELSVSLRPPGQGRYALSGGTLNAGAVDVGGGSNSLIGTIFGGSGSLVIAAGATANVTGTIRLFNGDDDVYLTGGTLNVATIDTSGGGHLHFTGGALNFTGSLTVGGTLSPLNVGAGQSVSVVGTTTLTAGTSVQINGGTLASGSINAAGGGTVVFTSGTLRFTSSGLNINNTGLLGPIVQLNTGQRIDFAGNNSATLAVGAQLQLNGGSLSSASGTLSNSGLVSGSGIIAARLNNAAAGEIRALSGNVLRFQGVSNSSAGSINIGSDGQIEFTAALTNSGTIAGRGTIFTGGTGLTNNGTISLSGGFSDIHGALVNNNASKAIVTGASTSTFYNAITNNAGSEFRVSIGSTAVFLAPVSGLASFTGSGVKIFESTASGSTLDSPGSSVVEADGILTAVHIRENALTVNGIAATVMDGSDIGTSRLHSLTIDGGSDAWIGVLDLFNNALVVDYTGTSPIATIQNQIKSGYAGGTWKGTGITSGAAADVALDATNPHKTALGFAEASALGVTSFAGQSIAGQAVLVDYVYYGDANLDGRVNALDFNSLASSFALSGRSWINGDFDYNGIVNSLDFNAIAINFNSVLPSAPLGALVPEPLAVGWMILPALAHRRRRR